MKTTGLAFLVVGLLWFSACGSSPSNSPGGNGGNGGAAAAGGGGGTDTGGTTTQPPAATDCLGTTPCAPGTTCPSGQSCNMGATPPQCSTLYCGGDSHVCSDDTNCKLSYACFQGQCVNTLGQRAVGQSCVDPLDEGPKPVYMRCTAGATCHVVCNTLECNTTTEYCVKIGALGDACASQDACATGLTCSAATRTCIDCQTPACADHSSYVSRSCGGTPGGTSCVQGNNECYSNGFTVINGDTYQNPAGTTCATTATGPDGATLYQDGSGATVYSVLVQNSSAGADEHVYTYTCADGTMKVIDTFACRSVGNGNATGGGATGGKPQCGSGTCGPGSAGGSAAGGTGGSYSSQTGGNIGTSSGGSTSLAPSASAVTFNKGIAVGAMTGPGWVEMGSKGDAVTDPVCSTGVPPTNAVACTSTTWNSDTALCTTGTINALPETPTEDDFNSNWGIRVGVSAQSDGRSPIGQSFSNIAVAVSGSPISGLRVYIATTTSDPNTPYCASWNQSAILLTSFNTSCWDNAGTFLTAADVPNITKVMIQAPSAKSAIPVNNLCMTGISFGN